MSLIFRIIFWVFLSLSLLMIFLNNLSIVLRLFEKPCAQKLAAVLQEHKTIESKYFQFSAFAAWDVVGVMEKFVQFLSGKIGLYTISLWDYVCTSLHICSSAYVLCIRRNDNGCRNSYTFDMKRPAKYTKGLFSTALTKDGRP